MQAEESTLSRNARAALDGLRQCSLAELCAIELYHFRRVKNEVAKRTGEQCAAKVQAEINREVAAAYDDTGSMLSVVPAEVWDLEDTARPCPPVQPPESVDVLSLDDEDDEPLEPTPTVLIEPASGQQEAQEQGG